MHSVFIFIQHILGIWSVNTPARIRTLTKWWKMRKKNKNSFIQKSWKTQFWGTKLIFTCIRSFMLEYTYYIVYVVHMKNMYSWKSHRFPWSSTGNECRSFLTHWWKLGWGCNTKTIEANVFFLFVFVFLKEYLEYETITFHYKDTAIKVRHRVIFGPLMHLKAPQHVLLFFLKAAGLIAAPVLWRCAYPSFTSSLQTEITRH